MIRTREELLLPSAEIAPYLPYLRRYARALTGSQQSGDAYVRAALEAVIEGGQALSSEDPPKIALFRVFHAVWGPASSRYRDKGADPDIAGSPAEGREAFLLVAVEGFSLADASRVLARDQRVVEAEIEKARDDIRRELASRIMVIEDEPIIALDLRQLVDRMGHSCAGVARTHKEAVALAKAEAPDLILADIQLADGSSGLEAVKEILESFEVPVIFITAFPERLLTGERPEPTYLISKPFAPDMVRATIAQALFTKRARAAASSGNN